LIQEFFVTFIITFVIVLILGYIGQRLIINKNKLDNKTIIVIISQSIIIALLLSFIF